MKKYILVLIILLSTVSFAGFFKSSKKNNPKEKINVFTSILPQKFFVEKIGGKRVQVQTLVGPGKSPATYTPTPNQVIDLSSSKIFFTIGVPFENAFLKKIKPNLKNTKITDTSYGIKKRYLEAHSHGDEDDHHLHEDHDHKDHMKIKDPHIWLSPVLVKIQAKNIYNSLIEIDPQGEKEYTKNYNKFIKELDDLDLYLRNKLNPYRGNTVFVYHPAFGYFTDQYGLHQEAVETGGKEPVPSILEKIIEEAKEDNVKIVFVQPEFSKKSANAIANAIDGRVVQLNPLNPDYINNIKKIADEIEGALRDGK